MTLGTSVQKNLIEKSPPAADALKITIGAFQASSFPAFGVSPGRFLIVPITGCLRYSSFFQ